jgi:hypothetical protein
MNRQINKKLKGTKFTVEILEKLYNNDTMFHVIMDMKGNSIWFNTSFMELTGRCPLDLQKPNFVDISTNLNKEHPFTEILIHLLDEKPKEFKCKFFILFLKTPKVNSSEVILSNFKRFSFMSHFERIDSIDGPICYLIHIKQTYN